MGTAVVRSQDQLVRFRVFSSSSFPSVSGPSLLASGQVFVRDLMPGRVEVPLTDAGQIWPCAAVELPSMLYGVALEVTDVVNGAVFLVAVCSLWYPLCQKSYAISIHFL